MFFDFYFNPFKELSRRYAKILFIVGLLLIGFGILVWVLKEFLAIVAAAIFIAVGLACCISAVRILLTTLKVNRKSPFRNNVQIHIEEDLTL